MGDMNTVGAEGAGKATNCSTEQTGHEGKGCAAFDGALGNAKSEEAEGYEKTSDKQKSEGKDEAKGKNQSAISFFQDRKEIYQERQEIKEGMNQLDAELFELEQSGEVSHEDLKGVKEQYEALKERADNLPETPKDMGYRAVTQDILSFADNSFDAKLEKMEARMERLESLANGQEVSDRVPEGAIRVDHHYSRGDDTLMDTSMVSLGKDADGYEQFVAFSPSEQTKPEAYYRDEVGNFTTNRNEAVKTFDGVATDPSILPDNAILDDKGNYWRASGADKDGVQTFQPLRSGGDQQAALAIYKPFYQDAEGNFSAKKSDDSMTAKKFEKAQWEPKLPEGAVAVNANGDGKIDFHMVSIGADENGQERFIAVQQDYSAARPDQQIYTQNEDGSFETLDGEPMEALKKSDMSMILDRPVAFR